MASSKLKIDIRRNKILQHLRTEGMVSVAKLASELGATPVTIRTDLTALEQDGYLVRVQGGAVLPTKPNVSPAPILLEVSNTVEKESIAHAISNLISNGDTLFLNSGTTTKCVAEALRNKKDLNIVTNSLAVATTLGSVPSIRVVLLGGEINAQYGFTYGGDTQEQLNRYQADWVILSCEGICSKTGITTRHVEESIIDRLMISRAKKILLAADHSKIGHVGFAQVCECNENFTLVTDTGVEQSAIQDLKESGLHILQA